MEGGVMPPIVFWLLVYVALGLGVYHWPGWQYYFPVDDDSESGRSFVIIVAFWPFVAFCLGYLWFNGLLEPPEEDG
jgi:UDP-N-acetylmuramyl pentapeptide phosphotransferase/UDP-N-acetylglucosamine-1-phosphate transferase